MIPPPHYLYTTKQLKCSKVSQYYYSECSEIIQNYYEIIQNYYSEYLEITKLKNYTELLLRIFRTYSELWDHEICPKSSFVVFSPQASNNSEETMYAKPNLLTTLPWSIQNLRSSLLDAQVNNKQRRNNVF